MDTTVETAETASPRSALAPDKSIPQPAIEKPLIYRQSPGRGSRIGSGRSPVLPAAHRACRSSTRIRRSISASSPASSSTMTCWRSAPRTPKPGRAATPRFRREVRHHRRARHERLGRAAALCGVSGLGDDPLVSRPCHRPRRAFLLRLDARRHAARLARRQRRQRPFRAISCRRSRDIRRLPRDIADHARLRFHHTPRLQHAAEARLRDRAVRAFPADDPDRARHVAGMNALLPFLPDLLGGRQTARTIHFIVMAAAGRLLRHPHRDDPRGRPDQRAALDHHRLVSHRSPADERPPVERSA